MSWNGGRDLPDDELSHTDGCIARNSLRGQSQVLKVENLRPSSSNLFDRDIQQLSRDHRSRAPVPRLPEGGHNSRSCLQPAILPTSTRTSRSRCRRSRLAGVRAVVPRTTAMLVQALIGSGDVRKPG